MGVISEDEFERICRGIRDDRESIIRHNPIGTDEEILLWMLLSCMVSYLDLADIETPCFKGKPDAEQYRNAIDMIVTPRRVGRFNVRFHLDLMLKK